MCDMYPTVGAAMVSCSAVTCSITAACRKICQHLEGAQFDRLLPVKMLVQVFAMEQIGVLHSERTRTLSMILHLIPNTIGWLSMSVIACHCDNEVSTAADCGRAEKAAKR